MKDSKLRKLVNWQTQTAFYFLYGRFAENWICGWSYDLSCWWDCL